MITMHAVPDRQTDTANGRTNIIAIAQRFVLTNASRANNTTVYKLIPHVYKRCVFTARSNAESYIGYTAFLSV